MGLFADLIAFATGSSQDGAPLNGFTSSLGTHPPGATLTPRGVHFKVYTRHAEQMDLCLYDPTNPEVETCRVRMEKDANDYWHAFIPSLPAGALYGYRAHGPWKPDWGLWFNPSKLLLDPYAKALHGLLTWQPGMQNQTPAGEPDSTDHAATALKSVVVDDHFDWEGDTLLRTPWSDTIIYEVHVRGFTMLHPDIPERLRGTYAGMAHPESIAYLKKLGITAVQLLPIHQHLDDGFLLAKGLTNYWGYNTAAFFAPHSEYAAASCPQDQVTEFKALVKALHRAGIEVILDVVYNHTAEGDENGPNLCFRGLDNPSYYLLNKELRTVNYTGTGNTVNAASSPAMRLIMDSLRYWVEVMHVDGFRFDLGATLGRNGAAFNRESAFFNAIAQDPILQGVKMIAEPWDMGPDGYQVGGFPKPWHELNGRYRDTARRFWCGDTGITAEFAKRLCGSSDIYGSTGRGPHSSVNFFVSHDGFTLRDLWTYHEKRNEANGEGNRDGDNSNHSWNCGAEGETTDRKIQALRRQLGRSMLATAFCSLGTPFLYSGDERWRTQEGNNNAYCQDNALSWFNWKFDADATRMLEFTQQIIAFRNSQPMLRRTRHFTGRVNPLTARADVNWLCAAGKPLDHASWHDPETQFFAALLEPDTASDGAPLLLLFNGPTGEVKFPLPSGPWQPVFDTAQESSFFPEHTTLALTTHVRCAPRSVACLVLKK